MWKIAHESRQGVLCPPILGMLLLLAIIVIYSCGIALGAWQPFTLEFG